MVCAALAASVTVAACGSSSNSAGSSGSSDNGGSASAAGSSRGSSAAAAPGASSRHFTGSPIKLGMVTDVGTAVDFAAPVAAAKAAVRQLNGAGGINGHEVQFIFCNEGLNPNTAESCARKMVSHHVMAMVANGVVTAEGPDNAIFRQAGIANVAPYSFSGVSTHDSNSYMFSGGSDFQTAASVKFATASGDKRIALAALQSPIAANYLPIAKGSATHLGATLVGTVNIPQTQADLSTYAATLVGYKPEAVLLQVGTNLAVPLMKDMDQLGYTGKFLTDGDNFKASDIGSVSSNADQLMFVDPFPPVTATNIPGVKLYNTAVAAEKAAGDADADTNSNIRFGYDLHAWLAVRATAEIADAAKATTAAAFEKAIKSAKNVDMYGVIPKWTPGHVDPKAADPRVTNGAYYEFRWDNGTEKLASTTPVDVTGLMNAYAPKK